MPVTMLHTIWQKLLLHPWICLKKLLRWSTYPLVFDCWHYHLQLPADPKRIAQKPPMLFLASMGKTELSHDIFLNCHCGLSRLLRSNDLRRLNFEAATSKFCNCSWKFGSSPQKGKVDLCMTNGSKVLIYLTLLYFLLHYLQEYSKIWNRAKSNKSKIWNRLSYRGLS